MRSLHGRLLVAASLALAAFLGATGAALHNAFRDSAEAAMRERLEGHVLALLAAAHEDEQGRMVLPEALPDPRLGKPDSGLYALVETADGQLHWRSPSLTGRTGGFLQAQSPGAKAFQRRRNGTQELYVISFGIAWEDFLGAERRYTFAVAADTAPLQEEIEGFAAALWLWLGGSAAVLLLVQGAILRWGLRPLRTLGDDLRHIEDGHADRLEGDYPRELVGLTGGLNALIESSRANQQRYRHSLDDLAHSMKTPLAILRNAAEDYAPSEVLQDTVREQVGRMDGIVQHQLRRAASAGRTTLGRAVAVAEPVERLARSLDKVYRDKRVAVDLALDPASRFFGDPADLLEILGNVLENAFKYGRGRVRVGAVSLTAPAAPREGVEIRVEDDGPGIDPAHAEEVMQRGRRLDQTQPGQGIGLSVAREIVAVYGGAIRIGTSNLGGACVEIRFPPT